ncbi:MAG: DNA mismatch repair endonuclease MutL [Gemmatimonadota bacterium]
MTRRIQVLPDEVANQIAAGEVVERPASVVRELVENALDAGATAVEIQVERGGKRRIRVTDDGQGMSREDAILALDRHATSKIEAASDLRTVRSFGFRGEALPSIAAVSRLRVETHDADGEVGTLVRSTGGRILSVSDVPRQRGTTVEAQGLFFNAPARSAFLKSVSAETRAVSDVVATLALAYPGVRLVLRSDDRLLLDLPASTELLERLTRLWGEEAAATFLTVHAEEDGYRVRGVLQRPDAAQPGVRRGHLFVNGRPFRDPRLQQAVDRGYRTTVSQGVRPWYVLYLEVPDGAVDVNVHPQKAEVRFREGDRVQDAVERAVRAGLASEASSATLDAEAPPPRLLVREGPPRSSGDAPDGLGRRGASASGSAEGDGPGQMALFVSAGGDEEGAEGITGEQLVVRPERTRLWQLHDTYILAETRDGVLIIDQHSAHERVLFERLMRAYGEGGQSAQRLLFPLTLRLTPEELRQVEEVQGILHRAGFEAEPFGNDTVIVHSVPDPHPWFDAERCFREMVGELAEGTSDLMRSARNQHERIAMTFACKGSIKAGQRLDESEMQELFDALFATELPHHDVHGRPTIVRLSTRELERKFGR